MQHSVELHFSEAERARLFEFLRDIEGPWQQKFNPHISFAVIRDEADPEVLREIVRKLAAGIEPIEIQLSSVGLFPGKRPIVFWTPAANESLLRGHQLLLENLENSQIQPIRHYRAGSWTPHLTLSMGRPWAETGEALKALLRTDFPGSYQLDFVDLIEFHPAKRLERHDLQGHDR